MLCARQDSNLHVLRTPDPRSGVSTGFHHRRSHIPKDLGPPVQSF